MFSHTIKHREMYDDDDNMIVGGWIQVQVENHNYKHSENVEQRQQ